MTNLLLVSSIISLLVFLVIIYHFLSRRPVAVWAVHPFSYFTFALIFMAPFRGIARYFDYGYDYGAHTGYIIYAIIYTTLFYLIAYIVVSVMERRPPLLQPLAIGKVPPVPQLNDLPAARLLFLAGLGICELAFVYVYLRGGFNVFGDSQYEIPDPLVSAARLLLHTRWFFLGLGLVLWRQTGNLLYLLLTLGLLSTFFPQAVFGGGRGSILVAGYFVIILLTRNGFRLFPMIIGAGAMTLLVVLLLGLTFMRLNLNLYSADPTKDEVLENAGAVKSEMSYIYSDMIEAGFDRKSYHADVFGILVEQRMKGTAPSRGIHAFGSLPDLTYLVPQFITTRFLNLRFEQYMGLIIMGNPRLQFPVGPAAEAYYMLDVGGLLLALYYGWLMAFIYKKLFLNARSALAIGFYFFILFMVLIAGGSALTNNVVVTLKAGLLLVPLIFVTYRLMPRRRVVGMPGQGPMPGYGPPMPPPPPYMRGPR